MSHPPTSGCCQSVSPRIQPSWPNALNHEDPSWSGPHRRGPPGEPGVLALALHEAAMPGPAHREVHAPIRGLARKAVSPRSHLSSQETPHPVALVSQVGLDGVPSSDQHSPS